MYSAIGAGFTFLSLKMNRFRKTYIEPKKWLRILEPVLIVFIMSLISGMSRFFKNSKISLYLHTNLFNFYQSQFFSVFTSSF